MPYCAKCGTEVQEGTKFCPECGQQMGAAAQQAQPQPGVQPQPAPKKKKGRRIVLFVVLSFVGVCVVLFAVSLMAGNTPDEEKASQVGEGGEPAPPTATPTPIPPAPPFEEMRDNGEEMTEAQWKAYSDSLKGLAVTDWEGWVSNVDKEVLGSKYQLFVDLDSPDELFSTYDVYFYIPESDALKYSREQRVRFSGVIDHVTLMLTAVSIELADATVQIIE